MTHHRPPQRGRDAGVTIPSCKPKGRPVGRPESNPTGALRRRWPFPALGASRLKFRLDNVLHTVVLGGRRGLNWRQFLTPDEHLDFVGVENFPPDECTRNSLKHVAIVGQKLLGRCIALVDQLADFLIDLDRRVFAVIAMLSDLAAQEDLLFLLAEG